MVGPLHRPRRSSSLTDAVALEDYDHDHGHGHDEDVPFLDYEDQDHTETHGKPSTPDSAVPEQRTIFIKAASWQVKTPGSVVLLIAATKFFVILSAMIMVIPIYRLIEDALCHVYYKDDSNEMIEEMKCKVDEVQANLALLMGWLAVVGAVINFIVAYPYGLLSDSIGRKPVLIMSYAGMALAFASTPFGLSELSGIIRKNPYYLMIGSVFTLFGGGFTVFMTTLYAAATDVSTEENKASNFLYLMIGASAGGLLGPVISGILMKTYNAWFPIYVSVAIVPLACALIAFIPETLKIDSKSVVGSGASLRDQIAHGFQDLRRTAGLLRDRNILLVSVVYLTENPRASASMSTLAQYISKHYGWTLAEVTFLLSPLGILHIIILAVLPKVSEVLMSPRYRFTSFGKDLFLTRISMLILTIASILQGISPNIVMFIMALFISVFGGADSPLARATVSHYVDASHISRLYALLSMVEVLGSFLGGPITAWFFKKGLEWKGIWSGLPWFYISLLCALTFSALIFVKPPSKFLNGDEEEEGEDVPLGNPVRLE
ncbi:unnamed protein product [Clonostachys rosea f. rosea IK726]|uniref:Major facilitator superfamily (MFS) profile domain-containing protein n=2 Tax=Bionectria ochroleuca TaxID=29856 RepID=A0A0B7KFB1_BIOOC|nr:unnamed protein product [Clonostachys rosea f. rosea IK726]